MRRFLVFFVFLILAGIAFMGLRWGKFTQPPLEIFTDMKRQPKYKAQSQNKFFEDGLTQRAPIEGTVGTIPDNLSSVLPNTVYYADKVLATGLNPDGSFYRGFPSSGEESFTSLESLQRGRQLYDINCALCHGLLGDGEGITKPFGMTVAATLQDERIRAMAEGEIFNTITHGKGLMLPYNGKLTPPERWQVIAYLRALQRSQNTPMSSLPR